MRHLSIIVLLTAICFSAMGQKSDAILGQWANSTGEAHIEISKRGSKYYGKIAWLKEPSENGRPKTDLKNPNSSLRTKPILGLELLKNFIFDDGKWVDGSIYDPKSGKTYSCTMTLKENGQLSMRGYIGISLVGRSEIWKRVK
jgi:uncharacterized protein (DUF2147 family)